MHTQGITERAVFVLEEEPEWGSRSGIRGLSECFPRERGEGQGSQVASMAGLGDFRRLSWGVSTAHPPQSVFSERGAGCWLRTMELCLRNQGSRCTLSSP